MRILPAILAALIAAAAHGSSPDTQPGPTLAASAALDVTAPRPIAVVIEDYVRVGLQSNLALRSAALDVAQGEAALDAARGRFFPEASLSARYTQAEGGREISLPLGAVLNPVYGTLNELLVASGAAPRFGTLEDPRFLLQREREQDSRLIVRQALFAPAIPAAVRAQRAVLEASEFNRVALEHRLRRDITVGYLDWLRAIGVLSILEASRTLLEENLRVTEALFRSGKITQDQLLRARAERLAVEQQFVEAGQGSRRLQSYLNFLLNRSLDTPLEQASIDDELGHASADLEVLRTAALAQRPEIGQLDRAVRAAEARRAVAQAARWPTLALGIDGGIQGERYEFGRGRNFATVSVLLNWTLLDGGSRRAEVRGARLAEQQLRLQREQLTEQIRLEVQQALDALAASVASLRTAQARAEAAQAAFRIVSRKRDEGVVSQVEFLDARTSLTAAELNLQGVRLDVLARQADLDYITGLPTS